MAQNVSNFERKVMRGVKSSRKGAYDRIEFGYMIRSVIALATVGRIDSTCKYFQYD